MGRIIAITSMAVKQPVNNLILSNSVRASVAGLLKTLSNEVGSYGITVNNVMPGYTETERLMQLMENNPSFLLQKAKYRLHDSEDLKSLRQRLPFLRVKEQVISPAFLCRLMAVGSKEYFNRYFLLIHAAKGLPINPKL